MSPEYVIGVDGGGTHTRVRVAALDGTPMGNAEGPASAVSANGLAAVQQVLSATLDQARLPFEALVGAVEQGIISQSRLDTSLNRIANLKMKL